MADSDKDKSDLTANEQDAAGEEPPASVEPAPGQGQQIPSQPRSFIPKTQSPDVPRTQSPDAGSKGSRPNTRPAGQFATGQSITISTPAPTAQESGAGATGPKTVTPVKLTGGSGSRSALRPQAAAPAAGTGGDTIRLRVTPKGHASSALGTSATPAPRSTRQKLPDIRRRQTARSTVPTYGPFSILFGFLWLIFKMLFFTALILGLGAAAGYATLHWYIKRPEVTVPQVRGMKIAEAFEVLSEKKLGMVKIRSESSGLVAPGEIVEQSPPAGSMSKEGRAVGVVISSGRSKFTVPNVVGESIENARNKIKGAGLQVGNELRMEDATVPKEAIISQQPAANTGLDEATKVDLLVSSGPPGKGLTMPNVTGVTFAEAKAALSRLGITDIATDPPGQADGTVIEQNPLVGKTILQTDRISLKLRK
jgi:beta-lactam-binding protein with PASTA domain